MLNYIAFKKRLILSTRGLVSWFQMFYVEYANSGGLVKPDKLCLRLSLEGKEETRNIN